MLGVGGFTYAGHHSDEYSVLLVKTTHSLLPPSTARTLQTPRRPGAWYIRSDLGPRQIQCDVAVLGDDYSDVRSKVRAMAGWLSSVQGPQPLVFDTEPEVTYYAVLDDTMNTQQGTQVDQKAGYARMTLTFLCPDPFAYGQEVTVDLSVNTVFLFPAFPADMSWTPLSPTMTAQADPVFTATFKTASSDYTITRQEDGSSIHVIHNFAVGDVLVVDCAKRLVTINGASAMPSLDITSTWIALQPGQNTITASPQSAADLTVSYTPRWL